MLDRQRAGIARVREACNCERANFGNKVEPEPRSTPILYAAHTRIAGQCLRLIGSK
jgi:hypothetical protein